MSSLWSDPELGDYVLNRRNAFLICPVRGHDIKETENIVESLESDGWNVYWPPRDTDQDDKHGFNICCENRQGIIHADKVFVIWDGKSTGSLFDLGMAFALHKPIEIIEIPELTPHKSFQNMMSVWAGIIK